MKLKYILVLTLLILFSGCNSLSNTPTRKVEIMFSKYQTLDEKVLIDLDDSIKSDGSLSVEQIKEYKEVMKKQYSNLTYIIKGERIDGVDAVVEAEITVMDYGKILKKADDYRKKNMKEFSINGTYSPDLFTNYKLDMLKKVKDNITYTLDITLSKKDSIWEIDTLKNIDKDKINGIYES